MLRHFGEYPEKYRTLIWRYLLSLPLNKSAFEGLIRQGPHPSFQALHKRFPLKSYKLYNKLVRVLSALAHWCPLFAEVDYLPQVVFPFVKAI